MSTQSSSKEIWLKFAQLVQHANVANCNHASIQFIRDTNRFIASRKEGIANGQLIQARCEHLAYTILELRNVDLGTPDEIRIKKQCLEVLIEMKKLTELAPVTLTETAPLIPETRHPVAEPEIETESELDREFRLLAS